VLCLLIKAGADLLAVNRQGKTAAQVASEHGYKLAASLLTRAAVGLPERPPAVTMASTLARGHVYWQGCRQHLIEDAKAWLDMSYEGGKLILQLLLAPFVTLFQIGKLLLLLAVAPIVTIYKLGKLLVQYVLADHRRSIGRL
jgi:hypothetical protein